MSGNEQTWTTAVLVSGGGTTALNLIEAQERREIPVNIALVVAHRENIAAVARCRATNRPVVVLPGDPSPAASDQLDELLVEHGIELVLLAGYLRRLRVGPWAGRVLNIHPALLPNFGGQGMYGRRVHDAVITSGAHESGCTVHLVDDRYDHGPTIVQRRVAVLATDTSESLARRVFAEECIAYPDAIRIWAQSQQAL